MQQPEILAPAGDRPSFLAAVSAGADAIYLGLKHFSARMQAENFGISELVSMVEYAHSQDVRVYIAMNTLLKPEDMNSAANLVGRLARDVGPDALIIQDTGFINIARQAGFEGELHLSTLANITHPSGLLVAKDLGASRVILPRELSIDEIRIMGDACPKDLELELFVHGALCYCVSGRCYWSSYMGGKSGLRGRCVQPCRRVYRQGGNAVPPPAPQEDNRYDRGGRDKGPNKGRDQKNLRNQREQRPQKQVYTKRSGKVHSGRYFSCMDLSIDVLTKTLLEVPHLGSWKIEGRKKGPHYVYHVVTAYKLLRDNPSDSKAKKMAEEFLQMALGRPTTRARFLPQKQNVATSPFEQTSSGLLVGKTGIDAEGRAFFKAHRELLARDYLRIGIEDQSFHSTMAVSKRVPKAGTLVLRVAKHKTPKAGTSVFLIDRREPELIDILNRGEQQLANIAKRLDFKSKPMDVKLEFEGPASAKRRADMNLRANIPQGKETRGFKGAHMALWLSPKAQELSRTIVPKVAWWLPPVIWPEEEKGFARLVNQLYRSGARHFVCNAAWQHGLFGQKDELDLIAGPFCNCANIAHINMLKDMGFTAVIVSPELTKQDLLLLPKQSSLPLGFVLKGFFPVGIARFGLSGIKANEPFASPKGEIFWARNYGSNTWVYPAWPLDFSEKRFQLENAGYSFFVEIGENPPASLPEVRRHGLFNWDNELL